MIVQQVNMPFFDLPKFWACAIVVLPLYSLAQGGPLAPSAENNVLTGIAKPHSGYIKLLQPHTCSCDASAPQN